jgi:uncharacterized protein YjeT (DUF2065 family)
LVGDPGAGDRHAAGAGGLLPLFAPGLWRQLFAQLLQLRDGQLRFCGLLCIAAGAIMLMLL